MAFYGSMKQFLGYMCYVRSTGLKMLPMSIARSLTITFVVITPLAIAVSKFISPFCYKLMYHKYVLCNQQTLNNSYLKVSNYLRIALLWER